ncbi:HD domain-containing phosphohydrolase [Natranaerofaba carboxydovora]|uniref:HD domain-containing phosphohydrolase n=1 Tax=Natranaerofaba carboxydovora TaxID=2742683 RepID=UPI001F12FE64|nr:HD domain-containing phosphohydrolase [Natranaerofaba carboxydovora]UMZ73496.1 Cyclic di-GMP phosphodiesterase response regulator RpfG [Natranaerofaba carboxydovora]
MEFNKESIAKILDVIGALVIIMDSNGKIEYFNPECEALTGFTFEEVKDCYVWDVLITEEEKDTVKQVFNELNLGQFPNYNENYWQTKTGKKRLIDWRNTVITDDNNEMKYIVGTGIDITDNKQKEDEILETKLLLEETLNSIPDIIAIQKPDYSIIRYNEAGYKFVNKTPHEVYGEKCYKLINKNEPCEDCATTKTLETKKFEKSEKYFPEYDLYLETRATPVLDEDGEILYIVEQIRDITDHKKALNALKENEQKFYYLSYHDRLTGLYNRIYLEDEIIRQNHQSNIPISIIMADVNGLKLINDTYGRDVGDKILICVANIFRKLCREEDIIARWGEDDFVVILPKTTEAEASELAKKLKDECSKHQVEEEIPIKIAVSTAVFVENKTDFDQVLKEAEDNMYKNKLVENESSRSDIISALLGTLKEKSDETEEHALRMTHIGFRFAEKLGLSYSDIDRLSILATMHDIGKVIVPEDVLKKPGKLSEEEWEKIKQHPITGSRIASTTENLVHIAEGIASHHERWDGKGYPKGLKGEEIPLLARIIAIIDAYDVMTTGRTYQEAKTKEEALEEIKRCAGTQFDPELAHAFVELMEEDI